MTLQADHFSRSLEKIKSHLSELKLHNMVEVIDQELNRAVKEHLPITTVLEKLLLHEVSALIERRIERRIRTSKLPERKLLADFDFAFQKGLDKAQIMELATLSFIENKQSLVLAGSSGTGKSHIAKALLLLGCKELYRCRYTTAASMLRDLIASLADDTLEKKLKVYTRPQILLIDEVGFDRMEQEAARPASLFFRVISERSEKKSTLMTTNIDFKELGDYLGDPVITTALVDRLIHHAIVISIEGPSYRMYQSKKLNNDLKKKRKNASEGQQSKNKKGRKSSNQTSLNKKI